MKGRGRISHGGITGIVLAAAIFSLAAAPQLGAETKNFYFPEVRIDIAVAKDGSFTVDERRTYEFEGGFSWASLWIPLRADRKASVYDASIEDFSITDESGAPLRTETSTGGGRFTAKWYYSARNERRTFRIHYLVRGGILSYPDISELYWQAIGSGWDKPTAKAEVVVRLPEAVPSREDIRVFGHGPLSGWAEIVDERTARFTASNLPSGQFFEVRVLWPAGMVSGITSTGYSLASIREEEAGFVRETIEKARRAQEDAQKTRRKLMNVVALWAAGLLLLPIVWLFIYLRVWKRIGKDYRFDDIPPYARELPSELPPALVQVLLREGRDITPAAFTATLFDVARRGFVEIEDRTLEKRTIFGTKSDLESIATLRRDFREDPSLKAFEKDLLELLFVTVGGAKGYAGDRIGLDDLKDYLKKKPQKFQTWYQAWVKTIKQEAKSLRFIEPESLRARNIFLAASFPAAILTLNLVWLVLVSVLVPKMKRRGREWARENEMWRAFRRFLDDFPDFKEVPPEAYKLWEHYLVFGILFGNAKKIIKMLPVILADERAMAPVWYSGYGRGTFISGGRLESMVASIEHMSTSIAQASTSAAHYSSGGGGGFSGAGGGGGGGGGGSAG